MATLTKVSVNGQVYDLGGSGVGGDTVEITYDELVLLYDSGNLIPGAFYKITDYVTDFTDANGSRKSACHAFDLTVEALSSTTLSEKAKASIHDGDDYFKSSDRLDRWDIWYRLKDGYYKKGIITRMIDNNGNDFPCDFKNELIRLTTDDLAAAGLYSEAESYLYQLSGLELNSNKSIKTIVDASIKGNTSVAIASARNNKVIANSSRLVLAVVKEAFPGFIDNNIITGEGIGSIIIVNNSLMSNIRNNTIKSKTEAHTSPHTGESYTLNDFSNNIVNCDLFYTSNVSIGLNSNIFNIKSTLNNILVLNAESLENCLLIGSLPSTGSSDIVKIGTGTESFVGCIFASDGEVIKTISPVS